MKIAYVASPDFPFDKSRPEAEAMIEAGIAKPFVAVAPARVPDAKWAVNVWASDKQPYIAASCNACGNRVQFTGPTAHRTQQFRHCGVAENAPSHIQEEYVDRRANWKPKPEAARTEAVPFEVLSHF
jgi:hypothetical protein